MSWILVSQMILAAILAIGLYTIIGFIPGTDETSVLMPISLTLILTGIHPLVALSFFVAAFVTLGLMNLMPTLVIGLPGGVMSTPMISHALFLKQQGKTATAIKKATLGSVIGVCISLPASLILMQLISPIIEPLKAHAAWLFILGAIFLSLISKAKILSLLSIVPLAILFQSLRSLYWQIGLVPEGKNITTSFFLGITVAPLLLSLLSLFHQEERKKLERKHYQQAYIPKIPPHSLNPKGVLTSRERKSSILATLLATPLFVLSPVGLTILLGEMMGKKEKDPVKQAETTIVTMSALAQGTYMSGLVISVIALGIPIAPAAIGPGAAFFEAPPIFSINHTITDQFTTGELLVPFLVGSSLALVLVYLIAMRFAAPLTLFVQTKIPHEAILAIFISLVVLLGYMDAGLLNVFAIILIALACGTLNRLGVNYGIQFMTLYAAPFLIQLFS
ncbi:tripartite tricarboxylate transporter permease [Vagococcus humatus]|uniref:Tripartite tricarboxylate transporter TctA family protein n=1 Tax=Vagococcus humatus TaxID=1889241 RepID=A0A3R9YFQ0_9ENTE|nr:tripartite tricarboxylate transporter permease [Vagococcus humatus]RST90089.1 tripartite tricarboxylate transporter TctA family protein [Vagococcus humatus]